jgi:hypothetical protein
MLHLLYTTSTVCSSEIDWSYLLSDSLAIKISRPVYTMKKSISQRRIPRKIGADNDDEDERMSSAAGTSSEAPGQYYPQL